MATKRTVTTETELDPKELEAEADTRTTEEKAADEELQVALAEIGDTEGKVQCVRTAPKDEAGIAGTYSAQEFSVERLRDEWGGGTYMLYFRKPNGQLKTKRSVSIIAKKAPAPLDRTAELLAALQGKKGDDNTGLILQLMQSQQKATTDMIVAMIGAQGNNKAQGMGPTELVALLGAIQGLNKSGDKNSGSSLDELLKVLKVAKELGGNGGEDDGWLGKLATLAGPLLEKLGDRSNETPAPLARRPIPVSATVIPDPTSGARPRPAPAAADSNVGAETAPPVETETPEGNDMNLRLIGWLRETLKVVLDKAEKNKDPVLYADYVLDNLPEGLSVDVILPALKAEDALDRLAFFDARVPRYRDWLEEFRDAMVETIEEAQREAAKEALRNAKPPEVPQPGADPVNVLNTSPNPSNDSEN